MGRLNEIMTERAIAVSANTPKQRAAIWNAMLTLDGNGAFCAADVARASQNGSTALGGGRAAQEHYNLVTRYLASLKLSGHVAEEKRVARRVFYRIARHEEFAPQVLADGSPVSFDSTLAVTIPRSEAGAWSVIRDLARRASKLVTVDAVFERMQGGLSKDEIADYIQRLARGGFCEPVDGIVVRRQPVEAWRLVRQQPETPRLRQDGVPLVGPLRFANMWRSMKMLSYFTALDLASAASLPELPITPEQAARYADDLAGAGYLLMRERAGEPRLYRLKETRNTGPAAPEVLRARFVWDPNLCRVVGDATAIEEVRP